MNGADALVKTFLASGLETCFANPGTSEMHFVAALDEHPDMRCILCLFEGGATGAADGFYRMSGEVAATLLHLGPGFGNGWANLHNATKGQSGIVNVVGDHATYHLKHDAPLQGNLEGVARSVSDWFRVAQSSADVGRDGAAAVTAARAMGGQVATLALPADCAWNDGAAPETASAQPPLHLPDAARIAAAAKRLAEPGAAMLVTGPALHGAGAELAGQIAARTGCRLLAPLFAPRLALGAGSVAMEHMRYVVEENTAFLADIDHLVLVGEVPPVSFFAYPGKSSTPDAPGSTIDRLCFRDWDIIGTLQGLAEAAGVTGDEDVARVPLALPEPPKGPLTPETVGAAVARTLPEGAIISNEAVTAAFGIFPQTATAAAHDRMNNTGGSIGNCLPLATGAAAACPERRVVAISGDGSAMYTIQSLWTMARERQDVTVVILANRGYQILRIELENVGATGYGRNAQRMFDVEDPTLDFVAIAKGHGVPGVRVTKAEDLEAELARANTTPGPFLIEAVLNEST
jgi:acetolactate synthase-1/2/3 large subunit